MAKQQIREDILIVLNEREALKEQLASELEHQLRERNLCCARIEPTMEICEVVLERAPRFIITDYILGDYATGLDILSAINNSQEQKERIESIVWTDEQSANVAVSAMKLGARDYILMDAPKSLERVLQAVENLLEKEGSTRGKGKGSRAKKRSLGKPLGQARSFQQAMSQLQGLADSDGRLTILCGPTGSGRNALAEFFHSSRDKSGRFIELDYDLWPEPIASLDGKHDPRSLPLLSFRSTVFIDHIEFDDGELLDYVHRHLHLEENDSCLLLGTSSADCAAAWSRLLNTSIIEVPGLKDRQEDVWLLTEYFASEVKRKTADSKIKLTPDVAELLREIEWPGNIKQLRSAIVEVSNLPRLIADEEKVSALDTAKLNDDQKLTLAAIVEAKERWERYAQFDNEPPDALSARAMLEACGWNFRMAAARLGTGLTPLRKLFFDQKLLTPQSSNGALQ